MNGSHAPEDAAVQLNGDVASRVAALEKSDSLWQRLVREYPNLLRDNVEMKEIRKQLNNKEIIMCVLGRHNCGKSTLLNTLLVNRCLPTNITNETGIHVKIKHDPSVHHGYCTESCQQRNCPILSDEKGTKTVGATNILKVLETANKHHRKTRTPATTQYTLSAHVPILENAPAGWCLALVDTPGFGEARMDHMTSLAQTLLNTSSAYLYIVDVTIIADETDAGNMKRLFDRDPRVFEDNRIVIAVTKFDEYHKSLKSRTRRGVGRVLSLCDLQRAICTQVQETTGVECPAEIIVPVSAEWAENARELRQRPLDAFLREDVTEFLRKVAVPLVQGQGETMDSSPPATLASQLEGQSGILQLEERLTRMIGHSMQCWVSNLVAGYTHHLNEAKTILEDELQEKLEGFQCEFQKYAEYKRAKDDFNGLAFIEPGNSHQIEIDLQKKFHELDMPAARVFCSQRMSQSMAEFTLKMKSVVADKGSFFGQQSLEDSITEFVEEKLQPLLGKIPLMGVASVFKTYQHEMEELSRITSKAALAFLPKNWTPRNDTLKRVQEGILRAAEEKDVFKAKELTVYQLHTRQEVPIVKVNFLERLMDTIKRFFGARVERPYKKWSNELDALFQKFEDDIIAEANRYIDGDLQEWTVHSLRDMYFAQVKKRAMAFGETYEDNIQRKLKQLQRSEAAVRERYDKDIKEVSDNLQELC